MNFNPRLLMELKSFRDQFSANHPKFTQFLSDLSRQPLSEGTVIEITVTTPEGKHLVSNLKLQESDLAMLQSIRQMNS